jgi:HEAT repeat protein
LLPVAIKASSRPQVDALLRDLSSEDGSVRESAVARLRVVGARAVGRLVQLVDAADLQPAVARAAALHALESIADPQALNAAARALDDSDVEVAVAAAGVLGELLRGSRSGSAAEALTRVAIDRRRPDATRLGAIDALSALEASSLKPLIQLLRDDPSEAVRIAVREGPTPVGRSVDAVERLRSAAQGGHLDVPAALQQAIVQAGDLVPLSLLRDVIERIREHEIGQPASRRAEWMVVRAAAHSVLAHRNSRIALYDVRETLQASTGPVPVELLNVVRMLGDVSCLEAIAAAHGRVREESWWRDQLAGAFRAIVARERITRRHPVMKKIEQRWPGVLVPKGKAETSKLKTSGAKRSP